MYKGAPIHPTPRPPSNTPRQLLSEGGGGGGATPPPLGALLRPIRRRDLAAGEQTNVQAEQPAE